MRRRPLLAALGAAPLAGCSALLPASCAEPDSDATRLEFETRAFESVKRWWDSRGTILATRSAHVERFEPPEAVAERRDVALSADERRFLEETDFDESMVVGVLVGSSGESSEPDVTAVVREDRRVHCYVCIDRRGSTDDLAPYARLIRVREPRTPEGVRVTFTNGRESTETFDSDGTGTDIAER